MALIIDGESCMMRLTLGALAELEAGLEEGSLVALVERFETNRFSSRDVIALLNAGLRGGGHSLPNGVADAAIDGGPMAAAKAAAELLVRAFMVPEQ